MKNILPAICFLLLLTSVKSFASKLIEVRVVDKDYIMVYFKDGEVEYRDDGTGASAFTGHDFADGDDTLLVYGEELNTSIVALPESWIIISSDDADYKKNGLHPTEVHRKAKVNNSDHAWNYKLDHWIFLKLPHSLKQDARYTIKINPETQSDITEKQFSFDIYSSLSEAIHVNIIGYAPESPVKSADLYLWMGDGGSRDYSSFEGNKTWLYHIESGEKYPTGEVVFWKESATEAHGRNLTGSDVWTIDFSKIRKSGTYRLVVENVGCSQDFQIDKNNWFEPYKTSVRGYFYMRIGADSVGVSPVPRRPLFIPDKDPEGFTVYLTDLDPFDPEWRDHQGDTWDEPHFKPAEESMFWKRRLPDNPTNPNAAGGHSDALDWDRHLSHVSNIYDLLLPYLLSEGEISDDNLDITESGNGIPDIIDEARNEVDMFLNLRDGEAYAQGLTNPSEERTIMFQAGTTTMAAWANAANCAMIGDCFRISGHTELMKFYREEAIKAFSFAEKQENKQLDDYQEVGEVRMRGRDFMMMAAAFLYNLTGDISWEEIVVAESVVKTDTTSIELKKDWGQLWGTTAYLLSPHEQHYPELVSMMKASIHYHAFRDNVRLMDIRPSRRSSDNNYWQTSHYLHQVILAHAFSDNPEEKELLEKAMILEADWGLGRNPTNTVEMTGLGKRHIVNCYTSGRNDGSPGLHPGHTPYNNIDPWGKSHNGSNPHWFIEKGYPGWIEGGWPHQEAFFNCRYTWANGEFTPRQTMRGKMALYAYLYSIFSDRE